MPTPIATVSAADALASLSSGVSRAVLDRIALEDEAYRRNPLLQRIDAGHECLIVTRAGQAECVPLPDLTLDELHALVGPPELPMDDVALLARHNAGLGLPAPAALVSLTGRR